MTEVIKTIGKNTIYSLIGKSVSNLLSIVLVFFIARLLGPLNYGTFSLTVTIIMLIQPLINTGFEVSLPYFLGRYKEEQGGILKKFIKSRTLIALIASVILYFASGLIANYYSNPQLTDYLKMFSLFIPSFILMNASYFMFQGLNNIKASMKTDIIFSVTKFAAIALIGLGVTGVILGYGISYTITVILVASIIIKVIREKKKKFTHEKELRKYALTSFIAVILTILSTYLLNLFLGRYPSELGFYDSSGKIGLFTIQLSAAIGMALLPSITGKKPEEVKEVSSKFMKYLFIYAVPLAVLFLSSSNFIINTLLGSEYSGMTDAFKIIVIALSIQSFTQLYESIAYGTGHPKKLLVNYIIRTLIILLSGVYLINALNASIVLLISLSTSFVYMSFSLRKYLSHSWKDYIKTLLGAMPLIISLNIEPGFSIKLILFIISAAIYTGLVYYKIFDNEDRELLTKLINKIRNINKPITLRN